jgi:subtilisin family serine protease
MKGMKVFNLLVVLSLLFAAGLTVQPVEAQDFGGDEISRDSLFVPGEVVVAFQDGQQPAAYAAQASALAGEVGAQVVGLSANAALLSFDAEADVDALVGQLGAAAGVKYAEPNYIRWIPEADPRGQAGKLTEVTRKDPNGNAFKVPVADLLAMRTVRKGSGAQGIPTYPVEAFNNWGWSAIYADVIWPNTSASPQVCVLDTGVDISHPDLKGRAINGKDFVNEDTIPNDDNGHGTHVAGVISASINNKIGLSGVSNGQVVAVKVLSAQGWGTTWDITQGIDYCAGLPAVKVINMSLGGSSASAYEYDRLENAILIKGKLLAAAAGNSGVSSLHYPSGWAEDSVCRDGTNAFPGACSTTPTDPARNLIANGILSVGAGRSPFFGDVWVDANGDSVEDANEVIGATACATDFSNFGFWVEIVAPGESIYSTVPVSYGFFNKYFYGSDPDGDGYDSWDGTSMATPHVAGAAARVWSIAPTATNTAIHNALINGGFLLNTTTDPGFDTDTNGYEDTDYTGDAPFCWPDATGGAWNDTSNAVYLDVAFPMGRTALSVAVSDAVTGLPLDGATVKAFQGTVMKDQAKVARYNRWVDLINLPHNVATSIRVNKTSYTTGDVEVANLMAPAGLYFANTWDMVVAVPPTGRVTGVVTWGDYSYDLDLYGWLPNTVPGALTMGPIGPVEPGDLSGFPFARWNRDGGNWVSGDWLSFESISMAPRVGFPSQPYYHNYSGNPAARYDFMVTDYGTGFLEYANYVKFRIWAGGKIIATQAKTDLCDTNGADDIMGNSDDEVWWHIGFTRASSVTTTPANPAGFVSVDTCSTDLGGPGSTVPYVHAGTSLRSINK